MSASTNVDFALQGIVTQLLTTNAPAVAPFLSQMIFTNNQFRFTLTGTLGSNYIVQATTTLSTNWISLTTNTAPFTFSETNGKF